MESSGREVALKVLRKSLVHDEEFLLRFKRESEALASVKHPGVAEYYAAGSDGDVIYYAMEFVNGEPLSDRISDGPLPVRDALLIAAEVADALAAAHRVGLVHRDVKPSNIILSPTGAKLTDFGIARRVEEGSLTTSGRVMGSLPYMSPEQVKGQSLTPASDVYALGALLFEMLTGRLPFDAPDDETVATKIMTQPAPLASRLRKGVPPSVEVLLVQMLSKDPTLRPRSASEAAARLRDLAGGKAPAPQPGARRDALSRPASVAARLALAWLPVSRIGDKAAHTTSHVLRRLIRPGSAADARAEAAQVRRDIRRAKSESRRAEKQRDDRLRRAAETESAADKAFGEERQRLQRLAHDLQDEAVIFEKRITALSDSIAKDEERARSLDERAKAGP